MGTELKNAIKNSGGPFIWQLGNGCCSAVSHFIRLFNDILTLKISVNLTLLINTYFQLILLDILIFFFKFLDLAVKQLKTLLD